MVEETEEPRVVEVGAGSENGDDDRGGAADVVEGASVDVVLAIECVVVHAVAKIQRTVPALASLIAAFEVIGFTSRMRRVTGLMPMPSSPRRR